MESIVSTPDPGDFHRPLCNGHGPALVLDALSGYDPGRGPDVEAGAGVEPTPALVAEQTRILDEELAALLDNEFENECGDRPENESEPDGSDESREPTKDLQDAPSSATLPEFEALTSADLQICPDWCIHQDLPVHGDGFDQDPDQAPHRGVEHGIHPIHGGAGIDHAGRADVTVQLEQDRDYTTGPVVTLTIAVKGIEQYAWLTLPEARALHGILGQLLTNTT